MSDYVKADDGRTVLFDPFCFVHKVSSEADSGTVKEIIPLIHEFLLFFQRQILEHDLIVRVCHGCAFGKGKEPKGDPLIPQVVEQVPAGCKDACFVILKGRMVILKIHKAVPAGIKDQEVNAVYLTECIRDPLAVCVFLIAEAQMLPGCLDAELIFKPGYFVLQKIQSQVNVGLVISGGGMLDKFLHTSAVYSPAPPGKVGELFLLFKPKGVGKVIRIH